jgi:hypothetical protein
MQWLQKNAGLSRTITRSEEMAALAAEILGAGSGHAGLYQGFSAWFDRSSAPLRMHPL